MAQFAHPSAPSHQGGAAPPRPANIRTLALQNQTPEDARQPSRDAHAAFMLAAIFAMLAAAFKLRNTPSRSTSMRWLVIAVAANLIIGLMAAFPYVFAGPAVQSLANTFHPLSALALAALPRLYPAPRCRHAQAKPVAAPALTPQVVRPPRLALNTAS